MLVSTCATSPPDTRATAFRTPDRVSTVKSDLATIPLSIACLTKHLKPLPQASASEPSGLNIRIPKSATFESCIKINPSAPTPKQRRQITRARADQSRSLSLASITMKSFPVPWSLENCILRCLTAFLLFVSVRCTVDLEFSA